MKSRRAISPTAGNKGVALVIVLAMLVLMTVLVATFFSSVTNDFTSAKAYSQGESAKQLADSAVNVVTAQIKDATAGFKIPDPTTGVPDTSKRLAWASQPGLIRTWDDSGAPANNYKLYSSDNMVVSGVFDQSIDLADITSGTWKNEPAIYTDLNSPVLIRDDVNGTIDSPDPARSSEKYIASAPIIDPNLWDDGTGKFTYKDNQVEGFSVTPPPSSVFDGNFKKISPVNNPVPMPVKWLYVLQDGQLTAPAVSGSNARFNLPGQPVPSASNPIVGRIAFWADDETSKINVNTASEGTFWDVPICASLDEMQYTGNPPSQGEFQRVPGHPAMTCLSSVLGGGALAINHGIVPVSDSATYIQNLAKICNFTPRFMPGTASSTGSRGQGSLGGTAPFPRSFAYPPRTGDLYPNYLGTGAQNIILPTAITPPPLPDTTGRARLYSTVDDILFKPDRTLQDQSVPSVITPSTLKQDRFFLTANSRAPEVTLFNSPRISLWPITWPNRSAHLIANPTGRLPASNGVPTQTLSKLLNVPVNGGTTNWIAPQEQLLAFCGQIGKDGNGIPLRYFFQRQNPDSPTYDYSNIQRNKDLLGTYLRALTSSNVPGFGGSFSGKYSSAGRDLILVNAFDRIRGLNMSTPGIYSNKNVVLYDFAGMAFGLDASGVSQNDRPTWQVVPMNIDLGSGTRKAIGQLPTIPEVALIFYATKRNDPYPVPNPDKNPDGSSKAPVFNANYLITATNTQTTEMRMVVYFNEYCPGSPLSIISPCYWVKATGASFQVKSTSGPAVPINFPSASGNVVHMYPNLYIQGAPGCLNRLYTPNNNNGDYNPYVPKTFNDAKNPLTPAWRRWEFVSDPITVDPTQGPTFTFQGTDVTFSIYAPNPANLRDASLVGSASTLVQTIHVDFSKLPSSVPVPLAPRWVDNQAVPKEATDQALTPPGPPPGAIATNGSVAGSNPPMFYAKPGQSNPEVAKPGVYLYQDEGFDTKNSFLNVFNNGAAGQAFAGTQISTNWARRLALASWRTNGSSGGYSGMGVNCIVSSAGVDLTTGGISGLPMLSGSQLGKYPSYYPCSGNLVNGSDDHTNGMIGVITPYDTVLSMALNPAAAAKGDARVVAALWNVPLTDSKGDNYYTLACPASTSMDYVSSPKAQYPCTTAGWQLHTFGLNGYSNQYTGPSYTYWGSGVNPTANISLLNKQMATVGCGYNIGGSGGDLGVPNTYTGLVNVAAFGRTASLNSSDPLGDWTNNWGNFQDGCALSFPDQFFSNFNTTFLSNTATQEAATPYFYDQGRWNSDLAVNFFSPNREVSSGVGLFGNLPTTDNSGNPQPWQTLLFSPNPAIGNTPHPGFGTIGSKVADHLLLDLFWMPVVEPYAISEPLSTAGKINLNYQIAPFSNITRKTGLYAVMKSTKITAIPSSDSSDSGVFTVLNDYKSAYNMRLKHPNVSTRYPINVNATLNAFDYKFQKGDIFRSASQICEMFLYPNDPNTPNQLVSGLVADTAPSTSNITSWWGNAQLTGDNSREAPYGHIYPRVTTKSNTFQVHYKVQVLKKQAGSDQTLWQEGKDKIVSEYRGSTILERFIDPNDSRLPDFATKPLTDADAVIDKYYRFRVVSTKAFTP